MDELNQGATAEVEQPVAAPVTQEVETHKSLDESIAEPNGAINERNAEANTDSSRDDRGRFKPVQKKEEPVIKENLTPETQEAVQASPPAELKIPNTWKKEAQDAWVKADPILRAEVERRE